MSKGVTPIGGSDNQAGVFELLKDVGGRFRTLSLFKEHQHPNYPAPFTLKRYNVDGYISMYLKYMDIGDPTEYQVGLQLLGSHEHWQVLTRAGWFKVHVTLWRDELANRMESERYHEMKDIREASAPDSAARVQATKWLATRYGKDKAQIKVKMSKNEKARHLRLLKEEKEDLAQDIANIGIK